MSAYTVTAAQLDAAVEAAQEILQDEVEVRTDYSGRGMCGDTCIGIVDRNGSAATLFVLQLAFQSIDRPDVEDFKYGVSEFVGGLLERTRTDNMGRDMITYWPSVQVVEGS